MAKKSRLSKHLEKQSLNTLLLSLGGILIIVLLIIKFGIPFIAGLETVSNKVSGNKNDTQNQTQDSFLSPPTLSSNYSATNSASVEIDGTSTTGNKVEIYLNGSFLKKIDLDADGTFTTSLNLSDGDNIIKAKSINGAKQSNFSESLTILFKNTPPNLTIDNPADGSTYKASPIPVTGKSDSDTKITINGFWAVVDTSGNYSYNLTLQNGGNEIKVDATDSAGNKTEKIIHVTYSP